jgi:hypothetical protein
LSSLESQSKHGTHIGRRMKRNRWKNKTLKKLLKILFTISLKCIWFLKLVFLMVNGEPLKHYKMFYKSNNIENHWKKKKKK